MSAQHMHAGHPRHAGLQQNMCCGRAHGVHMSDPKPTFVPLADNHPHVTLHIIMDAVLELVPAGQREDEIEPEAFGDDCIMLHRTD